MVPEYSDQFWQKLLTNKLSPNKISIYSILSRIGEYNLYLRLQTAAKNLNIDYVAISLENSLSSNLVIRNFYLIPINIINYFFKPKFNLAVTHYVDFLPIGYNIVYLNVPSTLLYNVNFTFYKEYEYLYKYDAYADLYSLVHGKNEVLIKTLEKGNKELKIHPIYFGDNLQEYSQKKHETLLLTGTLWGCARNSTRLKRALKYLADENLLYAIGLEDLSFLGNAYLGESADFAKDPIFVLKEFQKLHGIALVLTSLEHMIEGIPTLRIAEAAAAGNLIISDQNIFVRKYLGNNVLYVDSLQSDIEIYKQIKNHVIWARDNPDKAQSMAQNSHKIFAENFSIEQHLKNLLDSMNQNSH